MSLFVISIITQIKYVILYIILEMFIVEQLVPDFMELGLLKIFINEKI